MYNYSVQNHSIIICRIMGQKLAVYSTLFQLPIFESLSQLWRAYNYIRRSNNIVFYALFLFSSALSAVIFSFLLHLDYNS